MSPVQRFVSGDVASDESLNELLIMAKKKKSNMTVVAARGEEMKKLRDLMKGQRTAMLTTTAPDGSLRSRPMAMQDSPFDGVMWFFTDRGSEKTTEIRRDAQVNV